MSRYGIDKQYGPMVIIGSWKPLGFVLRLGRVNIDSLTIYSLGMRIILNKYKHYNCGSEYICAYCGATAETTDHVVPVSYSNSLTLSGMNLPNECLISVPACFECNVLAHSMVFDSFLMKRNYLKTILKARYRLILNMPDWTIEELNEIAGNTRKDIEDSILAKNTILERLKFSSEIFPMAG